MRNAAQGDRATLIAPPPEDRGDVTERMRFARGRATNANAPRRGVGRSTAVINSSGARIVSRCGGVAGRLQEKADFALTARCLHAHDCIKRRSATSAWMVAMHCLLPSRVHAVVTPAPQPLRVPFIAGRKGRRNGAPCPLQRLPPTVAMLRCGLAASASRNTG